MIGRSRNTLRGRRNDRSDFEIVRIIKTKSSLLPRTGRIARNRGLATGIVGQPRRRAGDDRYGVVVIGVRRCRSCCSSSWGISATIIHCEFDIFHILSLN